MKHLQIQKNLAQWRDSTPDVLRQKLAELHKDLQSFRLQKATGQLGQSHLMADTRREIARVKTILSQISSQSPDQ